MFIEGIGNNQNESIKYMGLFKDVSSNYYSVRVSGKYWTGVLMEGFGDDQDESSLFRNDVNDMYSIITSFTKPVMCIK